MTASSMTSPEMLNSQRPNTTYIRSAAFLTPSMHCTALQTFFCFFYDQLM